MPAADTLLKWHSRPAVARPLRYARRLLDMSPREIAARIGRDYRVAARPLAPEGWEPPERRLLEAWLGSRFLFGPTGARRILDAWRRDCPAAAQSLVDSARQGLSRWEVFGVPVRLEPGLLDWHTGDVRWTWELNRHQFVFTFATAYALTGELEFRRRIVALLEDWWRSNPAGRGVNWSSALEVALRSICWLWTLSLALDWPGLEERFLRRWLVSLYEHYGYLKDNLSLWVDETNHLIGEAAGLCLLASALPDLPDGERQQQRAIAILARQLGRQVTPDGVSREQSTGYQRFVLDFCRQVMALDLDLPPVFRQRAAAMQDFLEALGGPDGALPSIGDSDEARAAPVEDLDAWLGRASRVPVPETGFRTFRDGGYCLWRSDDQRHRMTLLFDCGPVGLWPNASHGHADALSVQVKLNGRWVLGDPGTGGYAAAGRVRDLLRSTAAHNTVTVDGLDQSDALDLFKWLHPVPARLLDAFSDGPWDYALGMHEGYHRLRQGVTHYRAVLFERPLGWLVADRLEGTGRHRAALRFHLPPGTGVRLEDPQTAAAAGLRLWFSEPGVKVQSGLWSRRFGQWESAPVLALEKETELPLVWFTWISPHQAEPPALAWSFDDGCHRIRYRRAGRCFER